MRNIITLVAALIIGVFFTGCGTTTIVYNKFNIERNLKKDISKIESQSVTINDNSKKEIIRKLNNLSYSTVTYNLKASEMNKEISKEFFSQYFKVVNGNNSVFTVNTSIEDFLIHNGLAIGNQTVKLKLHIEVLKEGKVILSKTYEKEAPGMTIVELRLTATATTLVKLQKGLLSIYEQDFKPDLLNALKNS